LVVSVDCYNYNEATATTTVWESILIFLGSIIYLRVVRHFKKSFPFEECLADIHYMCNQSKLFILNIL